MDDLRIAEHFPRDSAKPPTWKPLSFQRRYQNKWIKYSRLASNAKEYQQLVGAMIAYNDFQSYFFLHYELMLLKDLTSAHREMMSRWAHRMVLVNLEDTLRLIQRIGANPFYSPVMQMPEVRQFYDVIRELLPGKKRFADRKRLIEDVRNAAGAHLDTKGLIEQGILIRAKDASIPSGRVEYSTVPFATRFWLADDVMWTVVVGEIWGKTGPDAKEKINEELAWLHEQIGSIGNFLGHFIYGCIDHFELAS